MARESNWSLSIVSDVQVKQDSLNKASKIFDAFYNKYNNKSVQVDTSDLITTVRDSISVIKQLYAEGTAESTSWLHTRPELKAVFESILSDAEEMFSGIKVLFNNGDYVSGVDNILQGFRNQLSVVFSDIGGLYDELNQRQRELNNSLGNISFSGGYFTVEEMQDRVYALRELIEVQEELRNVNSSLQESDFESGYTTNGLKNRLRDHHVAIEEMQKYDLLTTEHLERRRALIGEINEYTWDDDDQDRAKENKSFDESIESLKEYIDGRRQLMSTLESEEYNLFSVDGIDGWKAELNGQIDTLEMYKKELEELRDAPTNDAPIIGGNLSEVVEQLKEIKEAINAIKVAFEPLTNALSSEDNALHKMLTTSIEDLNILESRLKDVYQMIDTISKKDFNVTNQNVISKGSTSNTQADLELIRQLRKEASATHKQVEELYTEALGGTSQTLIRSGNMEAIMEFQRAMSDFNLDDLAKRTRSRSAASLGIVTDELAEWKQVLLQFNELRNKINAGSFDASKYATKPAAVVEKASGDISVDIVKDDSSETKDILNEVKSLSEQIEEVLTSIRSKMEATFDFSTIDPKLDSVKTITDTIYQQFEDLQTKIKALDLNLEIPAVIAKADVAETPEVSSDTSKEVTGAAEAIQQEGDAAAIAAQKKSEFVEANKKAAESGAETKAGVKEATDAIEEEGDVAERVASDIEDSTEKARVSINKLQADQEKIVSEFIKSGGRGKVSDNIATYFNNALANAGVDASSITSTFGLKSAKDEDGEQYWYDFIKLVAKGTDELGNATTVTREYVVATGELINKTSQFKEAKDSFDLTSALETAKSKMEELKTRMGSFKVNIEAVEQALAGINDETTFNAFTSRVKDAEQKLSEIKATLKSSKSLDPITNAENQMKTIGTVVETYRKNIEKFADVQGFSDLETHLSNIETKIREFENLDDGIAKATKVREINAEIDQYNAKLKLVQATHQESARQEKQQEQAQKKQLNTYNEVIKAQEKLYNLKKKMVELDPQSAKGQETLRKITEAQNEYNEALTKTKSLTVGQNASIKNLEAQQKSELEALQKEHKSNVSAEQEAKDLEYVLSLYKQYTDAVISIKKLQSDTTGAVNTDRMAAAVEDIKGAKADLLALGIDVNKISESELLTEGQKNALLEEQLEYKKKIRDIENASADKAATKAQKTADRDINRESRQNQNYGKTTYNRENRYFEQIESRESKLASEAPISNKMLESLEKYKDSFRELQRLREQFESDPNNAKDSGLKKQFQDASIEVEKLRKKILATFKDADKFDQISESDAFIDEDWMDVDKFKDAKSAMMDFGNTLFDGKLKIEGFNDAGTEMYGTLNKGKGQIDKVTIALRAGTTQMYAYTDSTKDFGNTWSVIRKTLGEGITKLVTMYAGIYDVIRYVRQGLTYVKEIDLALTELKKVTDETDETYKRFLQTASETSAVIGSTVSDFTDATAAFARLGYSIKQSTKMAETAIVYKNVADGLDTVEEATDSIISTMMAYGIEADNTMSIIDKFNAVGVWSPSDIVIYYK